jgi:hypothetical protein
MADIVDRIRERIKAGYLNPTGFAASFPSPLATETSIAADEHKLGLTLPSLLKRLYMEIGNGGWGPGYGLLGLTGGMKDDIGHTAVEDYLLRRGRDPDDPDWRWPEGLLPICHWGCAIYSCLNCLPPAPQMIVFDPNVDRSSWGDAFFPERLKFEEWVNLWADGEDLWQRLYGDDGIIARSRDLRQ